MARSVGRTLPPLCRRSLKSLLLHVDLAPSSVTRLLFALGLADRLGATLTILFGIGSANPEPRFGYSAGAYADVLDTRNTVRDEVRDRLARHLPADGPPIAWVDLGGSDIAAGVIQEAAYADLLVLGASEIGMQGLAPPAGFVESVIMESGRPAIVVPGGHGRSSGVRTALVAWNGSAQAARAVTAALPLLRLAERVEVVGWSQAPLAGRFSGIDIERYLARHGVAANVVRRAPTANVGAEIAQVAARIDADLVVMGCFGHGRLRERVLGGATRSILHAMSVPTVMVH